MTDLTDKQHDHGPNSSEANHAATSTYAIDPIHSAVIFRVQHMNTGFTYGRFNAFSGTIVRHVNNLPPADAHVGFGEPRTTVHLHGGHQPARSDGFPTDLRLADGSAFNVSFERGEHFDYTYPLVAPGVLDDLRDGTDHLGDHSERASTLWYHDHILEFTSHNVYRGLLGFFLLRDTPVGASPEVLAQVRDTGDESTAAANAAPNALRLPSGAYDVPLLLQEKTFGLNGELIYDVFNLDGFLGEKYLVNPAR